MVSNLLLILNLESGEFSEFLKCSWKIQRGDIVIMGNFLNSIIFLKFAFVTMSGRKNSLVLNMDQLILYTWTSVGLMTYKLFWKIQHGYIVIIWGIIWSFRDLCLLSLLLWEENCSNGIAKSQIRILRQRCFNRWNAFYLYIKVVLDCFGNCLVWRLLWSCYWFWASQLQ